ncbi:translocation/assembly module TamB domain-containing protein [Microbulbifer sediminum]|uniref:translocation/assembly module TamB domain-containing protein n=1 Tax=Microbulbifer sediminum TaxID=2904250 RepID=UPI001EFF7225|nr:translocation/assembly module TamB [Microbulbifer sediminum]
MGRSFSALASGFVRAIATVLRSFWHSLSGRGALVSSVLLVLVLALLYFVGTNPGRVALTHGGLALAERLVPDLRIQTGELGSKRLGAWSFSTLKVDYAGEVLLQARGLGLDVDLVGLFAGRVDIERVVATELLLDMDVLQSMLEASAEQAEAEVEDRPAEPLEIPAIRLGQLDLDRLQVIDQRYPDLPVVTVDANGRFRWKQGETGAALEVRELDGAGLLVSLAASETGDGQYAVELVAREDSGGFAGKLLQLPAGQALDARGRIALRESGDRLAIIIEEFSLPLVSHRFELSGPLEVALSPWLVESGGLALEVDDTRHEISGSVSGEQVDADVRLNRLPVSISQPWQDFLRGGWLSADLSLQGPLSLPSVSGVLELRSSYRQQPVHLEGRVQTRDEVIQLEAATVEFAGAQMELAGEVDIPAESIDLEGKLARLQVDDIRGLLAILPEESQVELPPELSGTIDGVQVAARGPWRNPQFTADIKASPRYGELQGELRAALQGDAKAIRLKEFSLAGERFRLFGDGDISLEKETMRLQVAAKADEFPPRLLVDLPELAGIAVNLDADLSVSGPWRKPQLQARVASDGKYRDYRYSLEGSVAGNMDRLQLDGIRLELSSLDPGRGFGVTSLAGRQSPVIRVDETGEDPNAPQQSPARARQLAREARQLAWQGAAWLQLDGVVEPGKKRARGTVAGRNIPVSLAQLAGVSLSSSLEGEVSLDGEFSGPFASPEARVNILAQGSFREEPWRLQGDLGYRRGSISLSGVELLWVGRNRLVADGSLNEKELDLELRGNAMLADLELGLPAELNERGEITLQATAAGSPRKPQLQGEVRLNSASGGESLTAALRWQTSGPLLEIVLEADRGARRAAEATAQLAVAPILEIVLAERPPGSERPPLPLSLESRGTADLSVIAALLDPEIHAMQGQLRFNLDADGTVEQPQMQGELSLEGGAYEHRPSNTRLRRINLQARLTPDRWVIEQARAEDRENGEINIGGAVAFPAVGAPQLAFELRARRLHLLNTPAVRGAVSGTLGLTGTTEDARLEGRLTLRPLEVQVEQLFGSSVPEIEVVEVEVDGPAQRRGPPILENIALAIQVVLDQQSYVRGLGLNSELQGQVNVAGTAAQPDASGELTIVRGDFDLLGKRFELLEGRVLFENSEAAIFVKGRHEYSDGEIIAEISGTADDLNIEFSSTPEAAQDEIFAQLLFGKSLQDISPLQAVRLVTVVRTLQGNGGGFDPVAKTRELLGVDTLDIKSEEGEEGQDRYALSLGKYITSRIFIQLQRSTDPLNPWEAEMQIELRRNLNLELKSAGSNESGAGSVELQWKKDY